MPTYKGVEISTIPTDGMVEEAERGLAWREEYGRGGTEVGVARARDISNRRELSFDTVKRIHNTIHVFSKFILSSVLFSCFI